MRPTAQGDSSQSEFIRRECFSSIPFSEALLRCLKNADTEISGCQAGYLNLESPHPQQMAYHLPIRIIASRGSVKTVKRAKPLSGNRYGWVLSQTRHVTECLCFQELPGMPAELRRVFLTIVLSGKIKHDENGKLTV